MKPTLIFGKERCRVPVNDPAAYRERENIHLDVPLAPHKPLRIGLYVHIHEIHPTSPADGEDEELPTSYTSTATGIEGKVVSVRAMERTVTELVVKNDDQGARTKYAYLTIHHEDGVTVHLAMWLRVLRKLLLPTLPETRHVPLERNAILLPTPRRPRPLNGTIYNLVRAGPATEQE